MEDETASLSAEGSIVVCGHMRNTVWQHENGKDDDDVAAQRQNRRVEDETASSSKEGKAEYIVVWGHT